MKKVLILVTLAFFMLLSCGGKKDAATGDSASKDGNKEISFMIWDKNQLPGMEAIAKAYEAKHPDVKIKVQVTGWDEYWTKLEAAATGGALPDVFWMHSTRFNDYASNGMLLEMGPTIGDGYKNFPQDLVKLYELDGKNYAVPKDYDTIAVFYNKALFDKAGVPYPDGTWDWAKYLETAKKLTKDGVYGVAAPMDAQQGYWNAIYQNGGYVVKDKKPGYSSTEAQAALQWWVDLSLKEKVSPTQAQFAETDPFTMFTSGKVAMIQLGSWMVPELEQNTEFVKTLGITYLPKGKVNATIYNGLGYSGSAKTKYPEVVKDFLKFCASEEANLLQAKHASAIPAYNGTQQGWIDHNKTLDLKVFFEQLKYGVAFPTTKKGAQWRAYENELFGPVFDGKKDVKSTTVEYDKRMSEIIATE